MSFDASLAYLTLLALLLPFAEMQSAGGKLFSAISIVLLANYIAE